jgi:drug/metabolite transporter (DMT)-like permease
MIFAGLAVWLGSAKFVVIGPRMLWIRSLAGSASLVCTFFALTHMQVANALTLTNTFPLWVAVLSWPLLRRLPHWTTWAALLLAVLGVLLVERPDAQGWSMAALVAILASFATAVAMLGLNRLKGIDPKAIVVHFAAVSLPFCLAAGLIFGSDQWKFATDINSLLSLLGTGVMATIGQYFLTLAFANGEASKVSIVGLSQVVFALILDVFWWNHSIDFVMILGILLILIPTGWVMWSNRPHRELRTASFETAGVAKQEK